MSNSGRLQVADNDEEQKKHFFKTMSTVCFMKFKKKLFFPTLVNIYRLFDGVTLFGLGHHRGFEFLHKKPAIVIFRRLILGENRSSLGALVFEILRWPSRKGQAWYGHQTMLITLK